jgi:tetratricopeptide (TPR) repeat protein
VATLEEEISPLIRTDGSLDWIFRLAEIVARADVPIAIVRRVCGDLAWASRQVGQRMPDHDDQRYCAGHADPVMAARVLSYVHGSRLRFDFKFEELDERCSQWLRDFPDDAYIASLAALAALGGRSDRGRALLDRAMGLPNVDSPCRYVFLHALWFAIDLEDQAEQIITLSDEMIDRGEDGYNLYFWRSFALRRLGFLDEALASVDQAIALLPTGMNQVHQDYVRERELIKTTRLLNDQVKRATEQISAQLRAESKAFALFFAGTAVLVIFKAFVRSRRRSG